MARLIEAHRDRALVRRKRNRFMLYCL
jgi:hypothetical protein